MQLDTLYREVLVLRFHEELTLEEIAKVTRAPLSTVKSRLYRGLAAIKPKLERAQMRSPGDGWDDLRCGNGQGSRRERLTQHCIAAEAKHSLRMTRNASGRLLIKRAAW